MCKECGCEDEVEQTDDTELELTPAESADVDAEEHQVQHAGSPDREEHR